MSRHGLYYRIPVEFSVRVGATKTGDTISTDGPATTYINVQINLEYIHTHYWPIVLSKIRKLFSVMVTDASFDSSEDWTPMWKRSMVNN